MIMTNWTGKTGGLFLAIVLCGPPSFNDAAAADIDEIVVTSQRREQPRSEHAGNIALLDGSLIASVGHQHVHELMTRVPGAWISRGSGQEHLTAIRSPVLTGAGSCGGFLFLEDGIPIRPAGFCNVNQLFEINTEQAASVEVIRGPGNALYGSNALHGVINVLTPEADDERFNAVSIEAGANDLVRVKGSWSGGSEKPTFASFVYSDDSGFRDDSGYRQGKLNLKHDWNLASSTLTAAFSATDHDQETAGFIFGEDAYEDPDLNRRNLNPEAFREATSQRLYAIWQTRQSGLDIDVRPFLRHSDMTFLQHFLPGQPLEENGHVSAGAMTAMSARRGPVSYVIGFDVEWSDMFLEQTQASPTEGSDFLRETRPEGKHYDFDVRSFAVAPYISADFSVGDRLTINGGLRLEYLHYDYDNNMISGNTRDDGTACGFGGCLYTRPDSRHDSFANAAPKLAFRYALQDGRSLYGKLGRGFRAPQATELYRLQSGQRTADLDSEEIDSVEFGARVDNERWAADAAVFFMKKRDSVLRDAEGFNISGGKSRHAGAEIELDGQLLPSLRLSLVASYTRHEYDFDLVAARGEQFVSGNDIDTAPRWLGSLELAYDPIEKFGMTLQWTAIDDYYLDAENRFSYPGHDIVNVRARLQLAQPFSMTARVNNLFDEDYADRADYAFGQYRYFPGRGRELFVELTYAPGETLR